MTTTYHEPATSNRAWKILGIVCLASVLVVWAIGAFSVGALLGGLMMVVLIGGVAAVTLYSKNRYSSISLTAEQLRVGRETVAVSDIDPASVMANSLETKSAMARIATSAGQINGPAGASLGGGRLIGGAYATPLGDDTISLVARGEQILVATSRRAELLTALHRVTQR